MEQLTRGKYLKAGRQHTKLWFDSVRQVEETQTVDAEAIDQNFAAKLEDRGVGHRAMWIAGAWNLFGI